jgi:hypothetical protein
MQWLTLPVQWHTPHAPEDAAYDGLTPEQIKLVTTKYLYVGAVTDSVRMRWMQLTSPCQWYHADWDYSLPTVYYCCTAIGICVLLNLAFRVRAKGTGS